MAKKKTKKRTDGYVEMQCRFCDNIVERTDASAKSVMCWECTHLYTEGHTFEQIAEMGEKERSVIFVR